MGKIVVTAKAASADMTNWVAETAEAEILDIFRAIVKRTPVDTGRARGGWIHHTGWTPGRDEMTVVENRVPYIGPLERGHSKRAPKGIVGEVLKGRARP